jgi:hypothetical protein
LAVAFLKRKLRVIDWFTSEESGMVEERIYDNLDVMTA